MLRRNLLAALAALFLAPVAALASDPPAGAPVLEIDVAGVANGTIRVALRPDLAPQHVARIVALAESGAYDNVVFHRVIDGFMAQTGDVQFGRADGDTARAGMGGSDLPDLPGEFTGEPFERGTVGMARSQDPNSANSQFFIMFEPAPHLNGSYTVFGQVTEGMECIDKIKRGGGANGMVSDPDKIIKMEVVEK